MKRVALVLLFVFVTGNWGCSEECDPSVDRPYCDGNVVVSCPEPEVDQLVGTDRWVRRDCLEGQKCVALQSSESAICALETQPSAVCADGLSSACESATSHVYCSQGYVTSRSSCFSCAQTDAASATCEGGPLTPCQTASQCASGICGETGYCR